MTRLFFGQIILLADAIAEPVRVAATTRESRVGVYVAGLALAAAVAVSGLVLARRGRGKR
jgi:hypothetical protein